MLKLYNDLVLLSRKPWNSTRLGHASRVLDCYFPFQQLLLVEVEPASAPNGVASLVVFFKAGGGAGYVLVGVSRQGE